jgi:transcriptional regulator with XRE-family HTH domain
MKLADYLTDKGIAPSEFAASVGVTPEAIRLYIKGDRRPRAATMQEIHHATGGMVTANDFFAVEARA